MSKPFKNEAFSENFSFSNRSLTTMDFFCNILTPQQPTKLNKNLETTKTLKKAVISKP